MTRALLCCCLLIVAAFATEAALTWQTVSNERALCNDYSRAGYFKEVRDPDRWIVFLESGGLCYSAETCNRRFIHPDLRNEFATGQDGYPRPFDINRAWSDTEDRPLVNRINPFMTSTSTLFSGTGGKRTIQGRDLLDTDPANNPVFYNYSRVLIPYCSSDVWLGNDTRQSSRNITNQTMFLRVYRPEAANLQFTFRGAVIFQSVLEELINDHMLTNVTQLVLAGSSAGGVGIVNHAKWIYDQLSDNTDLSIITDSAWFINFRGTIYNRFNQNSSQSDDVLSIISTVPQCSNNDSSSPCCIRLHCMLNDPEYFPVGKVPVLSLLSLYDLFVLTETLSSASIPGRNVNDLGLEFVQTVAEYGGAMNATIGASPSPPGLSFMTTQCLQHIYFATSTLWADELANVAVDELSNDLGTFSASYRHTISSGVWSSYRFSGREPSNQTQLAISCNPSDAATIKDAVTMWFNCRHRTTLDFRDNCTSIHCNALCPDTITFASTNSDGRYPWLVISVCVIVVSITVFSILTKVIFYVWEVFLSIRQTLYLSRVAEGDDVELDAGIPDFPVCSLEEAVSVACIDLKYSVDFKRSKLKDEKADKNTVSLVIDDDIQETEEETNPDDCGSKKPTPSLYRQKTRRASDWTAQFILQRTTSSSWLRKSVALDDDEEATDFHGRSERESKSRYSPANSKTPSSSSVGDVQRKSSSPKRHKAASRDASVDSGLGKFDTCSSQDSSDPILRSYGKAPCILPSLPPPPLAEDGEDDFDGPMARLSTQTSASVYSELQTTTNFCCVKKVRKEILRGISLYFNPGELVGIMGPSGCGKTTFLDLLTGRRNTGNISGNIYINGCPLQKVREKFISNTGYVLQLATPYYEELTVRENLTLSAHMKLPNKMTWREKFERVEQVMNVTGLTLFQDTTVGGASGPGLSGGQKKRLVIALQLLTMPSVIFLDEPTSGLDATASIELLSHLNKLAYSNRTVVLTIHQPRFEIFYMFHKLILLSDGKVAYHGVPQKAYGFFVEALMSKFLNRGLLLPQLEEHNPADIIMDMLGKPWMREVILDHYQTSTEPELIKWAIKRARVLDFESASIATLERVTSSETPFIRRSSNASNADGALTTKTSPQANWFVRLAVLEARASKRSSIIWKVYLPLIFFVYGFVLGTTYFQQNTALFILSGFCVYSVASALFMFPVLQNYYTRALEVYRFERADGAGRAHDIVLQGFARFVTMAVIPVVFSAGVLYLLIIRIEYWSITKFLELSLVNMALNQTWIALLTFIICAFPSYAVRISPILSSVAGFSSGFFIPRDETLWYYRWIFYVNPNYYGFSAVANLLLADFRNDCNSASLDCYFDSGNFILNRYGFIDINPYINMAILLLMTLLFITLAVFSNWIKHTTIKDKILVLLRSSGKDIIDDGSETSFEETSLGDDDDLLYNNLTEEETEMEEDEEKMSVEIIDDVFESSEPNTPKLVQQSSPKLPSERKSPKVKWLNAVTSINDGKENGSIEMQTVSEGAFPRHASSTRQHLSDDHRDSKIRPKDLNLADRRRRLRGPSTLLMQPDQSHMVYQPSKKSTTPGRQFANLVTNVMQQGQEHPVTPLPTTPRTSLKERQQDFDWHVKATQEVVKESTEKIINEDAACTSPTQPTNLREVTRKLTMRIQAERQPRMATVVADAMAKLKSNQQEPQSNPAIVSYSPSTIAEAWKARVRAKKQTSVEPRSSVVIVPVDRLKELKKRVSQSSIHLKPEASPTTVRFADEARKSPRQGPSNLKKSISEKAVPSSKFPSIAEEEPEEERSTQSFPHLPHTPEMPAHFFAGVDEPILEEEGPSADDKTNIEGTML